jgi:hypothetical protein
LNEAGSLQSYELSIDEAKDLKTKTSKIKKKRSKKSNQRSETALFLYLFGSVFGHFA